LRLFNNLILYFTTQTDDSHAVPWEKKSYTIGKIVSYSFRKHW